MFKKVNFKLMSDNNGKEPNERPLSLGKRKRSPSPDVFNPEEMKPNYSTKRGKPNTDHLFEYHVKIQNEYLQTKEHPETSSTSLHKGIVTNAKRKLFSTADDNKDTVEVGTLVRKFKETSL